MAKRLNFPPWLLLLEAPGVIEVIACLHNHGPADHRTLCAYVEPGSPDNATGPAVRWLAAAGRLQLQAAAAGSLDHPTPRDRYELTHCGHDLARALTTLARRPARGTRTQRPGHWHH